MRSLLVLTLAAAAFMAFLIHGHFRAAALKSSEATALDHLRRLAERPGREPTESGGYRFRWERGDSLPELLVAGPAERGEAGLRWFATTDGVSVYEFDTALFTAAGEPRVTPLRRFLVRKPGKADPETLPPGWRVLE